MSSMSLAELIRKALDTRLAQVRVAVPARVESYDAATQTVTVKPLIKDKLVVEDGEIIESLPVLSAVPVAFPRGGGFFISFPIAAGDTGRIVVCDRSIDRWRKLGGEVDPIDVRMHAWGGAVFEPDLADSSHTLADAHASNMVVGKDGGVQIHLTPSGEIHLAQLDAPNYIALAPHTESRLAALENHANTHVHPTGVGPSGTTGTPLTPGASVASTKVKAI